MKIGVLAAAAVVSIWTCGQNVRAEEIKVYSTPTLKAVLDTLTPEFQRSSGHSLATKYDSVASLKKEIESGAAFDVAILLPPSVGELVRLGKIMADSPTDIARTGAGVAVRKGVPKPDISTVEALKRALLDAKSVSYGEDSASGRYMLSLFDRLAIADQMKPKLVAVGGGAVMKAIADGTAEMTVITIPNIVDVPDVELAGPLPVELQNYTVFTAGVATQTKTPDAAKALIRFLTTPAAAAILKAKGMERATP